MAQLTEEAVDKMTAEEARAATKLLLGSLSLAEQLEAIRAAVHRDDWPDIVSELRGPPRKSNGDGAEKLGSQPSRA